MSAADVDTLTDAEKAGLLETLTPEERAAMDDDLSDDEKLALAEIAEDDDDNEGDDDADADEGDADSAADDEADESSAAAEPRLPTTESDRVVYQAELPEDYRERMDGIAAKREELAAQFESGDLSFAEFRAQDGALSNEYRDLDRLATKAEIAQEMQAQEFNARWKRTVTNFADEVREKDGIDLRQDQKAQQKLDTYVKAVFSDPDNAGLSMRESLEMAYGMMKLVYKPSATATKPAATDPKQDKAKIDKAKAARTNKAGDLPPTLAGIPGGSGPGDIGGGEFADLDGLEGIDLEMAIAKMSPAQREKFASLG